MSSSLSLLSGSSRVRAAAVTLAGVMAAAVLTPVAAWAVVPTTIPDITAPTDASTVTDPDLVVTANSDAPQVRFVLYGQTGNPDFDRTVTASGGTATTSFSLLGLGSTVDVEAFDCDEVGACNEADKDMVTVSVDLDAPVITSPDSDDVVQKSVVVKVNAPGPAVQFFVAGNAVGKDLEAPFQKEIALGALNDGPKTIEVRQCSEDGTICDGEVDSVTVLKDTKGPRWSDLATSNKTVFPVNDNYKDSTVLSARVGEKSIGTKVEIRKAGGPLVRTISLGRVDAGKVRATWNGRKSNGDIVPKGKYLFRFVGTDTNGVVGKSGDKVVYVSDKKLVRQSKSVTVSAFASLRGNASGSCSDLFRLTYDKARFDWPKGVGYYSNVYCGGSGDSSVALGGHSVGLARAVRYGKASIQAFGAGAFKRAGPGAILSLKANGDIGAKKRLGTSPGWYGVKGLDLDKYVRGQRLRWFVGTAAGNWYDVKEFRIFYSYYVLR